MTLFARIRRLATRLPGRVVLAWFALAVITAAAVPIAHAAPWPDICTSHGGGAPTTAPHLDCPLCLPTAPPPAVWHALPAPPSRTSCPPRWTALAHCSGHETGTPPVRGPPQF